MGIDKLMGELVSFTYSPLALRTSPDAKISSKQSLFSLFNDN